MIEDRKNSRREILGAVIVGAGAIVTGAAQAEPNKFNGPSAKMNANAKAVLKDGAQISREDVKVVLQEIHGALNWLHKRGHLDIAIEHTHVQFVSNKSGKEIRNLSFPFWQLGTEI